MTALSTRLIEIELSSIFKEKQIPLSRYLTLEKAAKWSHIDIVELHDFIVKSKVVHAVVWQDQFLIHPNTLLKHLKNKYLREFKEAADPALKIQLLRKSLHAAKLKQ